MTYLDHAATTAVRPEVIEAIVDEMAFVGNASSVHSSGRRARRRVEESREAIATALGATPSEVIFTSGGTESDNLAIKGIFWARRAADHRRQRIVASRIEHHAVLDTVEWLHTHEGAEVTWLDVDEHGRVDPQELRDALVAYTDAIALVTVMWANNEVGTVQPIAELVAIAHAHGVPVHTDAVQAIGGVPVDFAACGADALSLTGHKLGGPIGCGVLLLRRDTACVPLLHGGGQERDVRSGTLDVPAIVGLARAVQLAVGEQPGHALRLNELRESLIIGVEKVAPDAVLNGHPTDHLPGIAHFSFPDCEGDSLQLLLDAQGIQCSTGSACSSGVTEASHVLIAMGIDPSLARGSLRASLGHTSTDSDVDALIAAIGPVVDRARRAGAGDHRK